MKNTTFPQPGCDSCHYYCGDNYFDYPTEESALEALRDGTYRPSTYKMCTFCKGPGKSIYCSGTLTEEDRYLLSIGG